MKTYTITTKIIVDEQDISKAKEWARRRGFVYIEKGKPNIGDMVFDYLTDGGHDISLASGSEIEECKEN